MRDGTERIHDGGPQARAQRRRERADAARRRAERQHDEEPEKPGRIREAIDRMAGHGDTDQ